MSGRRAAVVVLDACGVGALPDAADYGDEGAATLPHVAEIVGGLRVPTLGALGLGSVVPLAGVEPATAPVLHGRLAPQGPGKDSTTGHWELMGVSSPVAPPTYPTGFPPEVVTALEQATGRRIICNRPYNGIAAIVDHGEEHMRTGALIVYTSVDSVLQIAAHVDVVPLDELYAACAAARETMTGPHAVGRVIARPFAGEPGAFTRVDGRKDLALPPPTRSHLQELQAAGVAVHAVGKTLQLFAGIGFDFEHPGGTNERALAEVGRLLADLDEGFVFANLVDTDQVYGHRKDAPGFAGALERIDAAVEGWLAELRPGDLLVLTSDHGCDPTTPGTDHSREYAFLLARFEGHGGRRHDGALSDVGASAVRWLTGRDGAGVPGQAFV